MERASLLPVGRDTAGLAAPKITSDEVRRRFGGLIRGEARGVIQRGDHDLNPGISPVSDCRRAAVLVPLVERDGGLSVLLTLRTAHLSNHAGQVAFPGGRIEDSDADPLAAALRETEEEIGLSREHVEPIGQLDPYVTRTGFMVTPIVALVHPPFSLALDAHEVADAFEVPLDFLLDPVNRQKHFNDFQGSRRYYYVFPYPDRHIWGATAGMLVNLADVLTG
jgi:8-oxo-dGTP pyrophosphatase MutT (NUDIX family)